MPEESWVSKDAKIHKDGVLTSYRTNPAQGRQRVPHSESGLRWRDTKEYVTNMDEDLHQSTNERGRRHLQPHLRASNDGMRRWNGEDEHATEVSSPNTPM